MVGAEQVGDGAAAEERHADDLHGAGLVYRVDRHDIGVLESGQAFRLTGGPQRHFQGYGSARERLLMGEEDSGKCPLPQFFDQLEAEEGFSNTGERVARVLDVTCCCSQHRP